MLKNMSAQDKFTLLNPWLTDIFHEIKKDLKNEHLKKDPKFLKKYIGKHLQNVEVEDLIASYSQAIAEGMHHLAEFVYQRWLLKNTDMYDFFAGELGKVQKDFTAIEELDDSLSKDLSERSCQQFGACKTYCFSVINSVVFPQTIYDALEKRAQKEKKEKISVLEEQSRIESQEEVLKTCELKIERLIDKYEKKIAGLERKYLNDTEVLKKQLAALQKKLG